MQTLKTSGVQLAGTQAPLLEAEQVRVGVILAGILLNNIWEVIGKDGGMLTLRMLPAKVCNLAEHEFKEVPQSKTTPRGRQCACGLRMQETKDFLPLKEGKARIHIIAPKGEVVQPSEYAVYASREVVPTFHTLNKGQWSGQLPLIPLLHKVWDLPEAMKKVLQGMPESEQIEFIDPED